MMKTRVLPLVSMNTHSEVNVTINFQDMLSRTRVLVKEVLLHYFEKYLDLWL